MPDPTDAVSAPPEAPDTEGGTDVAMIEDVAPAARAPSRAPALIALVRDNLRVVIAVALLVCGVVFVMLGWYGAANTNIFTEQIPYLISGGLLGLGLIIVAGFMASSAMLERRTEQLREDLLDALRSLPAAPATNGTRARTGRAASARAVYVLPGGHSYHLPGCPIIEGKDGIEKLEPTAAARGGYDMCKLCGPE